MGKRILTGVVGIPILLGLLYIGGYAWWGFIAVLIAIGSYEFARMMQHKNFQVSLLAVYTAEAAMLGAIAFCWPNWESLGFATAFLIIFFEAIFTFPRLRIEDMAVSFMALIYVGWSMCHLILLERVSVGLLLYLVIAIWGSDSGAYFAGRCFGKHKLAVHLSPKKTKEGAVGGVFCAVVLICLLNGYMQSQGMIHFSFPMAIVLAIAISIVGQLGDLVESMLKRLADVKDSGNILPGHGGILDRFDSLILSAPILYYLFLLFY